jgi:hypothetical protein
MNNTGCDGFESEARRVISLMPKWSPGEVGGEPKRTICRLPFNFKINGGNQAESTKESKKLNANWGGFDFGFVSTNSSDEWSNKMLQSSSIGINLIEYKVPIFKQYLGLTTGLGVNFRTITFQNKYAMVSTDSTIALQEGNPTLYDTLATIKYSNFNQGFVQIPLLLDFSTKTRQAKSFSIAAGVIGGLRMYANHQLRGKYSNGDKFSNQMRDDKRFHSNLFALDATVRVCYGAIGVFGTYSLTSVFHKDAAPKLNPFCVGISINVDYNEESDGPKDEAPIPSSESGIRRR